MRAFAILLAQAWLVAASARKLEWRVTRGDASRVARLLAFQVLAAAQVVAVGLVLGYTGRLFTAAILAAHAVIFLSVWLATRAGAPPETVRSALGSLARAIRAWPSRERWLALGIASVVALLVATGTLAEHVTHDALSYRLSRIGYWLQEASIRHFATNEARQSYQPMNADLLMLWLTHPFRTGYPLATLAQSWGGVLVLLSAFGVAGELGLSRPARLGAIALVLGMPAVLLQFTTSQNDLVTAGLVSTTVCLGLASLRDPRLALPAWLALALALGAKGTVFYTAPGLVALAVVMAAAAGFDRRSLARHAVCATACVALLASPRYLENLLAWGDPFAPPELYADHVGSTAASGLGAKAALNLTTYAAQALDPKANAAVLAPLLAPAFHALVAALPEGDAFAIHAYPRRSSLLFFSGQPLHNADTASLGIVTPLLALAGAWIAIVRVLRRRGPPDVLAPGLAVFAALFFLCLAAFFVWWPTNVRFFSLVAVPVATLAALALETLRGRTRLVAWVSAVALGAAIAFEVFTGSINGGWRALPRTARPGLPWWGDHRAERGVVGSLAPGTRLGVLLPGNTVLAGLFRSESAVRVSFVTEASAEQAGTAAEVMRRHRLDALLARPAPPAGDARYWIIPTATQPMLLFLPASKAR